MGEGLKRAVAYAQASRKRRKPNVTDSCGCVFCDLDLEPTLVKITDGEWRKMHATKHGNVACTKKPKE